VQCLKKYWYQWTILKRITYESSDFKYSTIFLIIMLHWYLLNVCIPS
jgi:hypothetical protein